MLYLPLPVHRKRVRRAHGNWRPALAAVDVPPPEPLALPLPRPPFPLPDMI